MLYNYQSNMKINRPAPIKPNLYAQRSQVNNTEQKEINQIKRRTRIPFTKEEDERLLALVSLFGINDKNNWYFIANNIAGRTPRQCRERYQLFLSDGVRKKEKWTKEEDDLLISKYKIIGPHWKKLEQFFEGRTSYNIKNRFISLNRRSPQFPTQEEESNQITPSTLSTPIMKKEKNKYNLFDPNNHLMPNDLELDYSDYLSFFEDDSNFTVF